MENNAHELKNGSICGDGSSSSSSTRGLSPRGPNHHNHLQFNSANMQLPSQQSQHPPSNSAGMMAGGAAHRMPSPAPRMRGPPLMSAVSPMTAPVAQVAPVPRGFDHNQNQPMSQVKKSVFCCDEIYSISKVIVIGIKAFSYTVIRKYF